MQHVDNEDSIHNSCGMGIWEHTGTRLFETRSLEYLSSEMVIYLSMEFLILGIVDPINQLAVLTNGR